MLDQPISFEGAGLHLVPMYIEEVILEGFKSYATRTVISGWDPKFNAITGLNGTGKSNILDAICFVLGIDNLRQVRATSLQDLVYKRGQAGITKASVTIVFNNSDVSQSPIGYADCSQITVTRQIVLNGKNKYLINGHNAQQKSVENLFQSIQLNVNNPHFLIMQGQITRVLNMKPEETLAMVEESAGTRMFEDRKFKAIGTLEKKEKKVDEIASLIKDTIEPKLSALRSERSEFLEYKRTESEVEKVERLSTAYDYYRTLNNCARKKGELESNTDELTEVIDNEKELRNKMEKVSDDLLGLNKKRQMESGSNRKIKELEQSCRETAAKIATIQAQLDSYNDSIKTEESSKNSKEADITKEETHVKKIQDKLGKIKGTYETTVNEREELKREIDRDEELLRSLQTGLGAKEGSTGFSKVLKDARDTASQSSSVIKQSQIKLDSINKEIKQLEDDMHKDDRETTSATKKLQKLEAEISALLMELSAEQVSNDSFATLSTEKSKLEEEIHSLDSTVSSLKGTVASVDFRYSQPHPNFDHNKVKGTLASLVTISEENFEYATALEVAAGGKLYNVVVEDDQTATDLLEKGRLSRRATFIPLSKIRGRKIPSDKISLAQQLTNGSAKIALSLINYEESLTSAMEYAFGSVFICQDKEAASLVAFDKRLGFRAVTLQGDVYEPSGTLSGGSAPSSGSILAKLHRYSVETNSLAKKQERLKALQMQWKQMEENKKSIQNKERELLSKQAELASVRRQFELNDAGMRITKHNCLKTQRDEMQELIKVNVLLLEKAKEEIKRFEREEKELSEDREGKIAEISKRVSAAKSKFLKGEKSFEKVKEEVIKYENEIESSNLMIEQMRQSLVDIEAHITELSGEISNLNNEYLQHVTIHNGLRVKLEEETRHFRRYDAEIAKMEEMKKEIESSIDNTILQKKQLTDTAEALKNDISRLEEHLKVLTKRNPWIVDSKDSFGVKNGSFDFSQHNMADIQRTLRSLEQRRDSLRKTINFNVMDMIDRVEAKDASLRQMLATVKKDRSKIEETITKLNDFMLDALNKTWTKVNSDFGQIIEEILPGCTAKLDLLDGKPITAGLEIKVSLGGVWKQSLAELSGGQRSLVALSLILALLQFKPAPMYILDEVDAALDLSHTENIGRLLKSRFGKSQFIVVSLKEGMFSNANVLFRTRFRDGVSGVDRVTDNVHTSTSANPLSKSRKQANISKMTPVA